MANTKNRPCGKCGKLMWDTPKAKITGLCISCWPRPKHTEKTKAKLKKLAQARWENPIYIKRHSDGQKIRFSNPSNHPNWKGGITPINSRIRNSEPYKAWRMEVFTRDNFTCIWCGDNKGHNLNADHIKPFSLYPELRFDVDNGRTLCELCHKKTPTFAGRGQKRGMS